MPKKPVTKEQALAKFKEYYPNWARMSQLMRSQSWDAFIVEAKSAGWVAQSVDWVNPFAVKTDLPLKPIGKTLPKEVKDLLDEIGESIAKAKQMHYHGVRISNTHREVYFKLGFNTKEQGPYIGGGEFGVKWSDLDKYTDKMPRFKG